MRRLPLVKCILLLYLIITPAPSQAAPDTDFTRAQQAADRQQYKQAATLLQNWLTSHPQDTRAQYLLARVYAWQQNFPSALALYDSLLATHPNNSDYLLGKAQVLVWQGNTNDALPLLKQARAISPDYQAVWRLELQALQTGDSDNSRKRFDQLLVKAHQRFPDAPWLASLQHQSANEPVTEIEAGTGHQRLDNNLSSWHEHYISARHTLSPKHAFSGNARTIERFELTDRQLTLGYSQQPDDNWFFRIDADASSSHDLLPEWSIRGSAGRRLPGNWNAQSTLQHREYRFVQTDIVTLQVAHYWSHFRAGGTVYVTSIDGNTIEQETESSYLVSINYYYSSASHAGLSFAKGDELEYDGSASPLVTDITNVSIFGKHWLLNNQWAITYLIERQQQGNLYTRYGFRLGLRYRL